jgi:TolB protein
MAQGAYRHPMEPDRPSAPAPRARIVSTVVAVAVLLAACATPPGPAVTTAVPSGATQPSNLIFPLPTVASSAQAVASAAPSGAPTALPAPLQPVGRIGASGAVVMIGRDGIVSVIRADGQRATLSQDDLSIAFPTWSPDGTRIAAVRRDGAEAPIVVFDLDLSSGVRPSDPTVIFRDPTSHPFYVSWTPGGRDLSFLADDPDGLSLRVAAADGSATAGAIVRTGNPMYYDWFDQDQLVAHVQTGLDAFLGEIGRDGSAASPAIVRPGDFHSPVVSPDQRYLAYVRGAPADATAVVVSARDGSGEQSMPVYGIAAVAFDPTGDTVASIGAVTPGDPSLALPIGPIRLLDARTGTARTLLDGSVVSFWWSPDGKTIAALRVQPVEGATASGSTTAAESPLPSPSSPPTEVRLLFVDVASGRIRSQPVVQPAQLFIDQFLVYFDQYALSHHVWAPDSSSFLMPLVAEDGITYVAVTDPDGGDPILLDGQMAFWSP